MPGNQNLTINAYNWYGPTLNQTIKPILKDISSPICASYSKVHVKNMALYIKRHKF